MTSMSASDIAAALPGELEIELAGLDQKRKATVQGSTATSVSFLFNFTGAALSYTPTDGDFIIQKIQTITDTVADSVESAESETTPGEVTTTVLGVCITVENIVTDIDWTVE